MLALVLVLLLSLGGEVAWAQEDGQFTYQGFSRANVTLEDSATVMPNGLLSLTNSTYQTESKGYVFHPTPISFLTRPTATTTNTTAVARSFSTSFVFAIDAGFGGLSSYGLAFVVSSTTDFSTASSGKYMGLLNATNSTGSDRILAIELDTVMNPEFGDINSNHVGIYVNSLISLQAKPAGYYSDNDGAFRNLSLSSRTPMLAWIDYDGQAKQLNVTLAPMQVTKPKTPLLSEAIDLSKVMADTMYVGFASSAVIILTTRHYVLGWSFSLDGPAPPLDFSKLPTLPRVGPKPRSKVFDVVLPLATAVLVAAVLAAIFFFLWRRHRFAEVQEDWEDEFGPHRFAYKDLFLATNGFKEKNLLGIGGFGRVYKGVLPATNLEIAVKRVSHDSKQGVREFVAEVVSIGRGLLAKRLVRTRLPKSPIARDL